MKKSKIVAVSFVAALCFLILAVYLSSSTERLRAQLQRDLPIGSSSGTVNLYLRDHGWQDSIYTSDYEPEHPLSGRTLKLKARPMFAARDSYIFFIFDKPRGQEQKLQVIYVSSQPIHPHRLPPELQQYATK